MEDLEKRVVLLEVGQTNNHDGLTKITEKLEKIDIRLRDQEAGKLKIASVIISGLFLVCIGLTAFIFQELLK